MQNTNQKWRDFLSHLGSYVIIIGMLAGLNWITSWEYLWFLWPALGWGVGLTFHLWGLILDAMPNLSRKWRSFAGHFGSYAIIISMLAIINLMTGPETLWFLFPAIGWGIGLAFHLLGALTGRDKAEEDNLGREDRRQHRRRGRRTDEAQSENQAGAPEPAAAEQRDRTPARPTPYPLVTKGKPHASAVWTHLDKAMAYQSQIDSLIKASGDANTRARLQELAKQVDEWVKAIEALAQRIDNFQQDSLIRQDVESVPQAISDLTARLEQESDPAIRSQLERTLANRKNQWAALQRLEHIIKHAELQLEGTLSALGTIYSQVLTGQSTDHVADYSRLSSEVDEEVRALQDRLEALEEVKLGRV
ncbi:MAG: 2TM domain-containing protein [Anaerolineae bacterium]